MSGVRLILNPAANRGRAARLAARLRPLVEAHSATWAVTRSPGHATALATEAAADGCAVVVAAGGDGTVHEVVNGLMALPAPERPALGIVPLGSGNDFAAGAGIAADAREALRVLFRDRRHRIDVGRLRERGGAWRYWSNSVGLGFDAAVNLRSRRLRQFTGFPVYLAATLHTMALHHRPRLMRLRWDGGETVRRVLMLTVGNGPREGGGFIIAPDARVDDGMLDLLHIGPLSRRSMLRLLPRVMRGTQAGFPQVRMTTTTRLRADFAAPMPVHADGEVYGDMQRVEIEVVPQALELVR